MLCTGIGVCVLPVLHSVSAVGTPPALDGFRSKLGRISFLSLVSVLPLVLLCSVAELKDNTCPETCPLQAQESRVNAKDKVEQAATALQAVVDRLSRRRHTRSGMPSDGI